MFGKSKKGETSDNALPGAENVAEEKPAEAPKDSSGTLSLGQAGAEIEKLKAQFSSYYEMMKASNERFSRINEQVGELRSLLADRDRTAQQLEAKAARAVDIVSSVQPEKLMIEVQKTDAKVQAVRAAIESNETIMNNIVSELKEMRTKMTIYRGMDEAIKMFQETKKELTQIKMVETTVQKHADRVDTIFGEMGKSFADFTRISGAMKDMEGVTKQLATDVDAMKSKMQLTAQKKEVEQLTQLTADFEKKVGNVMGLINTKFDELTSKFTEDMNKKLERADRLLKGFDELAKKTPDLDKYFNLLSEEAKKAIEKEQAEKSENVEKIKQPGEGKDVMAEAESKKQEKGKVGKIPLKALNPFKKKEAAAEKK